MTYRLPPAQASTAELPFEALEPILNDAELYKELGLQPDRSGPCLSADGSRVLGALFGVARERGISAFDLLFSGDFEESFKKELALTKVKDNRTCIKRLTNARGELFSTVLYERDGKKFVRLRYHRKSSGEGNEQFCVARAEKIVRESKDPSVQLVLREHKKLYPHDWLPENSTPATYLECTRVSEDDWENQTGTMVHELAHELTQENCIFSPFERAKLCLIEKNEFPRLRYAAYKEKGNLAGTTKDSLTKFEDVYLKSDGGSYVRLFDELNSYTVESTFNAAILQQHLANKEKVTRYEEPVLPFIALLCANYLLYVKKYAPDVYREYFSMQSENGIRINQMLTQAEVEYLKFQNYRSQVKEFQPLYAEVWAEYESIRAQIK